MKKYIFIASFVLCGLVSAPFGVFAATTTAPASSTAPSSVSDAQLKAQLLSLKKKQNKTKTNLKINKAQAKSTITKVKKQRAVKKAKKSKKQTAPKV